MSDTHRHIVHPLEPIWNAESKILILGSFPSVKTREEGFFYGHPQNRFWPLLSRLLGVSPPLRAKEPERARQVLEERGIALWDSIGACDIIDSSDASIRNVSPTPLKPLVEGSRIRAVFCNGASAYNCYKKYQGKTIDCPAFRLPSSSPANAAWSMERLLEAWKKILDFL